MYSLFHDAIVQRLMTPHTKSKEIHTHSGKHGMGKHPHILLMEEILHQLIGGLSHDLQSFIHVRWLLGISSTNGLIRRLCLAWFYHHRSGVVGGFSPTHLKHMQKSIWIISPTIGLNIVGFLGPCHQRVSFGSCQATIARNLSFVLKNHLPSDVCIRLLPFLPKSELSVSDSFRAYRPHDLEWFKQWRTNCQQYL